MRLKSTARTTPKQILEIQDLKQELETDIQKEGKIDIGSFPAGLYIIKAQGVSNAHVQKLAIE